MPHSNIIMMIILGLQLFALYLIIFLHKQLLAIGLVTLSLILSAAIIMISRRAEQRRTRQTEEGDQFLVLLSSLFNHINQRHYQIHTNIEQLLKVIITGRGKAKQSTSENQSLKLKQNELFEATDQIRQNTHQNLGQAISELESLHDYNKRHYHFTKQHIDEESDWLDSLNAKLGEVNDRLKRTSQIADDLRLMTLNLSIEAGKFDATTTGFTRVADDVSRLARQTEHDNELIAQELTRLTELVEERFSSMKGTKRFVEPYHSQHNDAIGNLQATQNDFEVYQEIPEKLSEQTTLSNASLAAATEVETILKEIHQELKVVDTGFKTIKEYFIECMIHLDELKQELITSEDFHERLEKMNKMIAELYETEKTVHLTGDVLK